MSQLRDSDYMAFPFRVGADGPDSCGRAAHVRQQIEQVLFTNPPERVFRAEFGGGVKLLLFEPNAAGMREVIEKRLAASLADALQGEVDPSTLKVKLESEGEGETLVINVSYVLAAIGQRESHPYPFKPENANG